MSRKVRIVEVGPRDGLQSETKILPAETKVKFINMLSEAGYQSIEATAFVSPKWIPQLADGAQVFAAIDKKPGISYSALVPNLKGMEAAIAAGVREVDVFAAASETFSQKNINCSIAESLERFRPVMEEAKKHGIKVRGYVSCVLGCPFEGEVKPEAVVRVAKTLYDMGCYEISLGDTIGAGTPEKTHALIQAVKKEIPVSALAGHFHDTYGRALDNIEAALEEGVAVFDSSAAGLGGCPYAKTAAKGRAPGNVATEVVVERLHAMGIKTGIDVEKVRAAGSFILAALQKIH